jgi:hypothetical protein
MKRQKGLYIVEFAIVGLVFFILLFGALEFGRALFVWNTLTEATRRGARLAVVCPIDHASIKNVTLFNDPGDAGASPVLPSLDIDMVDVSYPAGLVQVRITGYQHTLLIPLPIPLDPLTAPDFETTLPRESLGCVPDMDNDGVCVSQCP